MHLRPLGCYKEGRGGMNKMCGSKIRHQTYESAQLHLIEIKTPLNDNKIIHIYECPCCGFYHVGHRQRKNVKHGLDR